MLIARLASTLYIILKCGCGAGFLVGEYRWPIEGCVFQVALPLHCKSYGRAKSLRLRRHRVSTSL
jgi:hypothetical protein